MNLLEGMNPEQQEAVLHDEGSLLVLAGAGSGKTRVITRRFAHLVHKHNLSVHNILCVTFTNKAAGEMKERISELLGMDTRTAWVRTFHSMCVRMLRRDAEHIGYSKDFTIYDTQDTKNTVKKIMERMGINPKEFNEKAVLRAIGSAKEDFLSAEDYKSKARDHFEDTVAEIFAEYQKTLHANQAMDFSDLINNTIRLLEQAPEVRARYQKMWAYIMADEFQDTNTPQFRLLDLLSRDRTNVCVVGDDDQSIYGWRGAKVENIHRFHELFHAHIVRLERNYRSCGNILSAANGIVQSIKGRMPKTLKAERTQGEKITTAALGDDRLQAAFVFEEMKKLFTNNNYKDFAVLYRTNAQSRLLEEIFIRHNVPFRIFGGQKFYDRAEIKDVLCYLRLIVNPFDSAAFDRIANVPKRKVGDKSKESVITYATTNSMNFIQVSLVADQIPGLSAFATQSLKKLGALLNDLHQRATETSPIDVVKEVLSGVAYQAYLIDEYGKEEGESRLENISELMNSIRTFEELNPDGGIADFLHEASLLSGGEEDAEAAENYVSLMSIHSAKGLEFPTVFVIGLAEGLFPLGGASTPEELNEEKRLFYVAVTRAMNKLYLSYEKRAQRYGEWRPCEASHFLAMIPPDIVDERKSEASSSFNTQERFSFRKGNSGGTKSSYGGYRSQSTASRTPVTKRITAEDLAPAEKKYFNTESIKSIAELTEGTRVAHQIFGEGIVEYNSTAMVRVNFKQYGPQVLMGNVISSIKKIVD
ncbi:MAG: ATP-dependent helicase [Brevinema sp.]